MGRVDDIAKRFSLAGVLDEDRQAKQRFPVEEIEVAAIEDHPANVAYSMDEDGIKSLAESIRKDGLTDIPMVRRKPDGGFQMLSGHRRKAAYALLAKDDPAFGRMPCRIVEGVSDDQAVTLLHTANYFTRELNVIERAKATQALSDIARVIARMAAVIFLLVTNIILSPELLIHGIQCSLRIALNLG